VVAVVCGTKRALRYADDVLLVHGGSCLHGPVHEVLTPEVIARVWGVGCYAAQAPDGTAQYLFAQH
jgi:iron complex transport system ATP-binding protein